MSLLGVQYCRLGQPHDRHAGYRLGDALGRASTATLAQGTNGLPSTGIPYVIVNGTVVVRDAKVLTDVYPGQPIRLPVLE